MRVRPDPGTIGGLLRWGLFWATALMATFVLTRSYAAGYSDDPAVERWFSEDVVKRCCSLTDGFEADEYESTQGGVWAIITDDGHPVCWTYRDEDGDTIGQTCRRELPDVRRIFVPEDKIIYTPRNPTGHGFLFIARNGEARCYFLPSGA